MLVGPVLSREMVTTARRTKLYVSRAGYVACLLALVLTAWLILAGTQNVDRLSDLARFGSILFQILVGLQLALALFFSALFSASAVAQEKDRRTMAPLLLTNLSNTELVLGKLLASLLSVLAMLAAAAPLFMFLALLGGVSFQQVGRALAITLLGVIVSGSLGSTVALWRDKTFQSLAMTAMILVAWLAVWETVAAGWAGAEWLGISTGSWAVAFSPWQAILAASASSLTVDPGLGGLGSPVNLFLILAPVLAVVLNLIAVARVRVWNPSRQVQPRRTADDLEQAEGNSAAAPGDARANSPSSAALASRKASTRRVWSNPILWREIRTWAYGRKVLFIRAAYFVMFAATAYALRDALVNSVEGSGQGIMPMAAVPLMSFIVLSLVLMNALAVTSVTNERDGQALDLLLATDLSPREFVFGKLLGVFYNTKEMILLPVALCVFLVVAGRLTGPELAYLLIALAVMDVFVAMLGIHVGMHYLNSRNAIGVSLGTVLFLFVGIGTCMRMMVAFSDSFQMQLQPFLAVMLGGGVGLYLVLGHRNPSSAIGLASFAAPPMTFYALTSFLIGNPLSVVIATTVMFGFATAAMLVPAIYEFDVAVGRTTRTGE